MLLNKIKYYFLLIIFFLIFSFPSFSQNISVSDAIDPFCDGKDISQVSQSKTIKNIEITTNNKRRWTKNMLATILQFYSDESKDLNNINSITKIGINWFDFRIEDKYKKTFKAKVKVNYENELSCTFKARVRITGDIWLHIDWKDSKPLTSVHVELIEGNINSITRFKLFLPKARIGNNELLATSLFKELGFIAPKTFMVSAKINGIKYDYMFQEDLRKEMLESSNLVEGPILEGDERFTAMVKLDKMKSELSLSRISNKNYVYKGKTQQKIALSAVSDLNQIFLQHHQSKSQNFEYLMMRLYINTDKFFLDKKNKERFRTFEALMYGIDALHGLSFDDRRFYYDPINKYFLPIYYDGSSHILSNRIINDLNYISSKASSDAKKGSPSAIKLINQINHENFRNKLINLGIILSQEDYDNLISKIKKRLNSLVTAKDDLVDYHEPQKYFSTLSSDIIKGKKLIFVNYNNKEYKVCSFNLSNCETNTINDTEKDLANILSQRLKNNPKEEYLFVSDQVNYDDRELNSKFSKNIKINNEFTIKHNNDISISINNQKREIIINQISSLGRIILTDGLVKDWKIFFTGSDKKLDLVQSDHLGLTGCLTFLDLKVKNLSIDTKNTYCEDAVNFIRTDGSISNLNIEDSSSDAFDADFSNLRIVNASIKRATNDCMDFSYGKYEIVSADLLNCGDKGLSVGEKSTFFINDVKINYSNIGVAAKDSSTINIKKSQILNSDLCYAAYRKKQEFFGAIIKVSNTNCTEDKFFIQKGSKIDLSI